MAKYFCTDQKNELSIRNTEKVEILSEIDVNSSKEIKLEENEKGFLVRFSDGFEKEVYMNEIVEWEDNTFETGREKLIYEGNKILEKYEGDMRELQKQQLNMVFPELLRKCRDDDEFNRQVLQCYKSWEGCTKYLEEKAKKFLNNKSGAVISTILYQWIYEYYALDNFLLLLKEKREQEIKKCNIEKLKNKKTKKTTTKKKTKKSTTDTSNTEVEKEENEILYSEKTDEPDCKENISIDETTKKIKKTSR